MALLILKRTNPGAIQRLVPSRTEIWHDSMKIALAATKTQGSPINWKKKKKKEMGLKRKTAYKN